MINDERKIVNNLVKDDNLIKDDVVNENNIKENLDYLSVDDKKKNKINVLKLELKLKDGIIFDLENKILSLDKTIIDISLRCKAEVENIRKRNIKDLDKLYKYSIEKFAIGLLPVIDNLKDALKIINKNDVTYKGIELTLKNFLFVIKKFGISVINEINVIFDPNYHQAMSVLEFKDKNKISDDNMVIEILLDGYVMHDRLLRPAMVKVLKYRKDS